MYLNEQSKHVEIVSSKSSEMNVLLPNASGEFVSACFNNMEIFDSYFIFQVEFAVPEQYKTTVNPDCKGITTTVVESLG